MVGRIHISIVKSDVPNAGTVDNAYERYDPESSFRDLVPLRFSTVVSLAEAGYMVVPLLAALWNVCGYPPPISNASAIALTN